MTESEEHVHSDAEPEDRMSSSDSSDDNSQEHDRSKDTGEPLSFELRRVIELDRINRIRQATPYQSSFLLQRLMQFVDEYAHVVDAISSNGGSIDDAAESAMQSLHWVERELATARRNASKGVSTEKGALSSGRHAEQYKL